MRLDLLSLSSPALVGMFLSMSVAGSSAQGQQPSLPMPGWDTDDDVPPHVLDLYAYLSARADGGLGPGKPGLIPSKGR